MDRMLSRIKRGMSSMKEQIQCYNKPLDEDEEELLRFWICEEKCLDEFVFSLWE
jgi:hypothetical protein